MYLKVKLKFESSLLMWGKINYNELKQLINSLADRWNENLFLFWKSINHWCYFTGRKPNHSLVSASQHVVLCDTKFSFEEQDWNFLMMINQLIRKLSVMCTTTILIPQLILHIFPSFKIWVNLFSMYWLKQYLSYTSDLLNAIEQG